MNQIRVILRGGLGNQLFQYAAGRALAVKNSAELVLDLSWFDYVTAMDAGAVTPRTYALHSFDIHASIYRPVLSGAPSGSLGGKWLPRLTRLVERGRRRLRALPIYLEQGFDFDPAVLKLFAPIEINGYWQSYKYFESIAPIIRAEISIPGEMTAEGQRILKSMAGEESICVHIRRGDYVSNAAAAGLHGVCSDDYYQRAITVAAKGLSLPRCYVFSDDVDWVRRNFRVPLPMVVVDISGPEQAHVDLWLMAACKHFVIANSSLSWWGAWLGAAPDKRVIAPVKWFIDISRNTQDLLPSTWLRE